MAENAWKVKESQDEKSDGLAGFLSKHKLSKRQLAVVCAGVLGLILIAMSSLSGAEDGKKTSGENSVRVDLTAYETQMEERLTDLVSSMDGAGKAQVMLTLDCGSEPIYATEGKSTQNSKQNGTNAEESIQGENSYVVIGSGNGESGLVLKTLEPKIRGVAVLCDG
ncbi:MAG: hypothetical protein LBB67_04220, partial [Oscillospiraceae bacterium]|nr:hypothetical protein [Oscillospiraceae bacterium]